jgi:hypothetical protein
VTRRLPVLAACAGVALFAIAPAAPADVFGPLSLLSRDGGEQFLYAHDPAISGDARYVVFDGSLGGVTGVWRRDLQTGEVEQVAGGDAELPSISENGQYVSFTTNEGGQLAADTNGQIDAETPEPPNVYLRNMALAPGEPGAFVLVSATNGPGETALSYETSTPALYGSVAAGRTALSANGQEVAFVTTAVSDLAGPGTPPLQVAVRNLATHETRLLSTELPQHPGEPAGPVKSEESPASKGQFQGAVFSWAGVPPAFVPPPSYSLPEHQIGASISADGSTVAWMGQDIGAQVPLLAGESLPSYYAEPLWRRVGAPGSPTRRVVGGEGDPFSSNHDQGIWEEGISGDPVPQLSANGDDVAFLSSAALLALGEDFGTAGHENRHADAYLATMQEGGSSTPAVALTPLSELSTGQEGARTTNAAIVDLAISGDGTQVAFASDRTEFPLPAFAAVTAPASEAGMSELYDVDLANHTLTRVTSGFDGGSSERPHPPSDPGIDPYSGESDGALSPSFSADGDTLSFSSTASNLIYGDGNTPPAGTDSPGLDGSDVFSVPRVTFSSTPAPQFVSSPPASAKLVPSWALGVTWAGQRNGSVLLYVELPGAGTVRAGAHGSVRVKIVHAARGAHGSKHRRVSTAVALRTVASAGKAVPASSGALVTLTLALGPAYRALAARSGGLYTTVNVSFSSPGHATLHANLPVTFKRAPAPSHKSSSKSSVRR